MQATAGVAGVSWPHRCEANRVRARSPRRSVWRNHTTRP
jgi:hypothetical protein